MKISEKFLTNVIEIVGKSEVILGKDCRNSNLKKLGRKVFLAKILEKFAIFKLSKFFYEIIVFGLQKLNLVCKN